MRLAPFPMQALNKTLLFVAIIAALATPACVKTGEVAVSKPLTTQLAYKAVAFDVSSASAELEGAEAVLKLALEDRFNDAEMFAKVGQPGDLTIRAKIVSLDKGDKAARTFNMGGEAEVTVEVELVDAGGTVLSKLVVNGNSARVTETKIGGYNTKWGDNLSKRALFAAAEQIVEYLEEQREGAGG